MVMTPRPILPQTLLLNTKSLPSYNSGITHYIEGSNEVYRALDQAFKKDGDMITLSSLISGNTNGNSEDKLAAAIASLTDPYNVTDVLQNRTGSVLTKIFAISDEMYTSPQHYYFSEKAAKLLSIIKGSYKAKEGHCMALRIFKIMTLGACSIAYSNLGLFFPMWF